MPNESAFAALSNDHTIVHSPTCLLVFAMYQIKITHCGVFASLAISFFVCYDINVNAVFAQFQFCIIAFLLDFVYMGECRCCV